MSIEKKSTPNVVENTTKDLYYQSPASTKKVNLSTTVIACFVTLAIGLAVGVNYDYLKTLFTGGKTISNIDFSSLEDIYYQLAVDFDGDLDKEKVIQEAKRGLVNAAGDDYTYYLIATEAADFEKDLNGDVGAGIGVEIGERNGYITVLRTTPDNPARKAGITVIRDNEEKEFKLVRETINNVSAYIEYKGDKAVITLSRFDLETGTLVTNLANEAVDKGYKKFVIDLRNNGGGYVSAAQEVASLWIDGDLVVDQHSSHGGSYNEKTYAKSGRAVLKGKQTTVLVNNGTATASEILAGALQDYDLAEIYGEQTYGKGSVQVLRTMPTGEMLRITTARWYTPKGQDIQGHGVTPDKVIERSFEQINKNEDPQMDAALER